MGDNLLTNGDFEADWSAEKSHRCHVVTADGAYDADIGNIFTPPGWVTWFRHEPGTFDQPEVRDAHKSIDPRRVHTGAKGMLLFTFWRGHYAGFYQRVRVHGQWVTAFLRSRAAWMFKHNDAYWDDAVLTLEGSDLVLTAWAHAWSNTLMVGYEGCYEDPYCSCGVGDALACIAVDEAPAPNGDPWNDAVSNFTFSVGIDVTGGTDPLADTVQWGKGYHIYNGYAPLVVIVPAPWRGKPRVQYGRTYVLLPPAAGSAWAAAVVAARWDRDRWTVGGSADDAGIGDLDARRVVAVNPHLWPGDLLAFFEAHYPGVEFVPVEARTPGELEERLR